MKIHFTKLIQRPKKRVGRGIGSGRGSKSGRGTKRHQSARETIPIYFEGGQNPLTKKFPLIRGKMRNNSFFSKKNTISLSNLSKFKKDTIITLSLLKKHKLISNKITSIKQIKIVANGTIDRALVVCVPITKKAKELIEKVGGTIKLHERNIK